MKLLRFLASLAICSATLALAATSAPAKVTLVNPGFETGNTHGWNGSGAAAHAYADFTAPDGSYFGLVRSPGCPGDMLEQRFNAEAGDVLTGWAFFRTTDTLPYNDDGAVRVVVEQSSTDAIVFSSSVAEVGDGGATPWTRFTFKAEATGSYVIQVRVANAIDCDFESAVGLDIAQGSIDTDTDAVINEADNCPDSPNPDQLNWDGDEQGDACDTDDDNDTFDDASDNCPLKANSAQMDSDGDGAGNVCDANDDNDAIADGDDNCQLVPNDDQADADGDAIGDACEADDDNDTIDDGSDNCQLDANTEQADRDADGHGDVCDADDDNDTVDDVADNCDGIANTDQADNDADRHGDVCDADDDNDTVVDAQDNCPMVANPGQRDDDHDGAGNRCDDGFDSSIGKASGGGWVRSDGVKVHFSVSATSAPDRLAGACTVTVKHTKITCLTLDSYYHDTAAGRVILHGDAKIDGKTTRYRIVLRDGADERFRIRTESGFRAGGSVDGGNIRIRKG